MIRSAILFLALTIPAQAWVESVEFPWNEYPRQFWERELVWLKNIGINHVSFPPAKDSEADRARLAEAIQIARRLDLEADLEGPVPETMQPLTRAHGGPLTDPLPGPPAKLSVLDRSALTRSREIVASGAPALLWTDVEDRIAADGYHTGGVSFNAQERPVTGPLHRSAALSVYWAKTFPSMREVAAARNPQMPGIPATVRIRQFIGDAGVSVVSIINKSATGWTGEARVLYPALKRTIGINVSVPANDAVWLPVSVPLMAGSLCSGCTGFGTTDHLVYATAEMTAMEYENGILAMEFSAPNGGEIVLQLSRQPYGPYVAGALPRSFDWDEHEQRVRLKIPQGKGEGSRVRIGLGIEAPDQTAFFDNAKVLVIGETNRVPAKFSSEEIAGRSRLRVVPPLTATQEAGKDPIEMIYSVTVPETAVHGDRAELQIEADGIQMTHVRAQTVRPASLRFADSVSVHLAADSALPLLPATVPVNQRGREITVSVRNNAPEIRNFQLEIKAEGLDFSPAKMEFSVGASTSRELTFRVFAPNASAGVHKGVATLSGAAHETEPVQFIVIPQGGAAAYDAGDFSLLESARYRAAFLSGRWLELTDKDNNDNLLPSTGVPWTSEGKFVRPEDLLPLLPALKK